jgi:hypothetical protein
MMNNQCFARAERFGVRRLDTASTLQHFNASTRRSP